MTILFYKKFHSFLLTLSVCSGLSLAGQSVTNLTNATPEPAATYLQVARPGALFLLIPPDARSAGMGSTGVATNPDVTSIFYNNAQLPYTVSDVGMHVSYTPWFSSISSRYSSMYLMSVGGYYKMDQLKNKVTLSSSLRFFNYGTNTEVFQNNVAQTALIKPFELSADLGVSLILTKGLSAGLVGRFVYSDLVGNKENGFQPAKTFLGDFTLFYEKNLNYKKNDESSAAVNYYDLGYDKFFASLVLANLGGKFNYQSSLAFPELPPSSIAVALGYRKIINEQNLFTVSTELNKLLVPIVPSTPEEQKKYYEQNVFNSWMSSFKAGASGLTSKLALEYWYNDLVAGRMGFVYQFQKNGIAAITFGTSFKYQYTSFDIAYFIPISSRTSIYNPLANTIRFGLSLYFK